MAYWNHFKGSLIDATLPLQRLRYQLLGPSPFESTIPLTPAEAGEAARRFEFARVWECRCGARLKVRAREDRSSAPSNFAAYPPGHPKAGHSRLPSIALTWDGLAEERGWKTNPTVCPACVAKLPMDVYKDAKRRGVL